MMYHSYTAAQVTMQTLEVMQSCFMASCMTRVRAKEIESHAATSTGFQLRDADQLR